MPSVSLEQEQSFRPQTHQLYSAAHPSRNRLTLSSQVGENVGFDETQKIMMVNDSVAVQLI
jgi:hypothetical protein